MTDWYQLFQELLLECHSINVIVLMESQASVFGLCTQKVYGNMVKAQIPNQSYHEMPCR